MKKINCLLIILLLFILSLTLNAQVVNKRIKFKKGESSAIVENAIVRGETHSYLVKAREGQFMVVTIMSLEDNAVIEIIDKSTGQQLPGAEETADAKRWEGHLPSSGNYTIIAGSTRGNASYTLKVMILNE